MKRRSHIGRPLLAAMALVAFRSASGANAQVAAGLLDPNVASEAELRALPHLGPATLKDLIAKRPFAGASELEAFLTAAGLTADQRRSVYDKAFLHVNLNTASEAELRLIPGAGPRMAHELVEYRPWKSWSQFDKEIGKYVDKVEVARLKRYGFIPMDANTASDTDLLTIPGLGSKMLGELKEYRPWKSEQHFRKEIGKYVSEKEAARLLRYLVIR